MRKQTPPKDFEIHVDPSCLSDGEDQENDMSIEEMTSGHHDSEEGIEKSTDQKPAAEELEQNEEQENIAPNQDIEPEHDAKDDEERRRRERQERIEAEIVAAARKVVASIENNEFGDQNDSVLSTQTDESYEPEEADTAYNEQDGPELSYGDVAEASFESDHDHELEDGAGDSSSQHDGDIDDVFSQSDQSKRSSLNSVHDLQSGDDLSEKVLTSPAVGEEAGSFHDSEHEPVSRIPSGASYIHTPADSNPRTPSKVQSRPPFRTPSSVRAMQMSSPTPSIFSSPRSVKRNIPSVSRLGTPTSIYSPSKRTPTRLKPRKENPLVLLHVTMLPLQWAYSHLMSSMEVPESLCNVKESWRLLQEKMGDTVLERGVLIPHPQDSYDVLEERLLETLELPVRPRAIILKCGHYMGFGDSDSQSSDDEGADILAPLRRPDGSLEDRKWCDICGRDVRLEEVGDVDRGEKRFRIKVYASNGLMRSGAWEACWKEMERIDVEIEPYIDSALQPELEQLLLAPQNILIAQQSIQQHEENDDGFEDEDAIVEHIHEREHEKSEEEMKLEEEIRQHVEKEEERKRVEENESRRRSEEEESLKRKMLEDQRMREIYGSPTPELRRRSPEPRSASRATIDEDSLSELLVATFKVIMQDTRNVMIGVLGVLVLLLVLVPRGGSHIPAPPPPPPAILMETPMPLQITTTAIIEAPVQPPITTTVIQERTVTEQVSVPTTVEIVVESVSTEYLSVTQLPEVGTKSEQSLETKASATQAAPTPLSVAEIETEQSYKETSTTQPTSIELPRLEIAAEEFAEETSTIQPTSSETLMVEMTTEPSLEEPILDTQPTLIPTEESLASTSTLESDSATQQSSVTADEPEVRSATAMEVVPIICVSAPPEAEAEATSTMLVDDPCSSHASVPAELETTLPPLVEDPSSSTTTSICSETELISSTLVEGPHVHPRPEATSSTPAEDPYVNLELETTPEDCYSISEAEETSSTLVEDPHVNPRPEATSSTPAEDPHVNPGPEAMPSIVAEDSYSIPEAEETSSTLLKNPCSPPTSTPPEPSDPTFHNEL